MATGTDNLPDAGDSKIDMTHVSEFVFQHFFTDGTMCFLDDTTGCYVSIESYAQTPLITYDIDPDTGRQNKPSQYEEIWSIDLEEYLATDTVVIELPALDDVPDEVPTFHRSALARFVRREGAFVKELPGEEELTEPANDYPLDLLDFGHDPLT